MKKNESRQLLDAARKEIRAGEYSKALELIDKAERQAVESLNKHLRAITCSTTRQDNKYN